jgi:hypothetical protein
MSLPETICAGDRSDCATRDDSCPLPQGLSADAQPRGALAAGTAQEAGRTTVLEGGTERRGLQRTALYAQRMTVEELFRDGEGRRNGFGLRRARGKEGRLAGCC